MIPSDNEKYPEIERMDKILSFIPLADDKCGDIKETVLIHESKGDNGYDTAGIIGFYTEHRGTGITWGTIALPEDSAIKEFSSEDEEIEYLYLGAGGPGYSKERFTAVFEQYIRNIYAGEIKR